MTRTRDGGTCSGCMTAQGEAVQEGGGAGLQGDDVEVAGQPGVGHGDRAQAPLSWSWMR